MTLSIFDGKKCTSCGKWRFIPDEFCRHKGRSDGLGNICRLCNAGKSKVYHESHKEDQNKKSLERYYADIDSARVRRRECYSKNAEFFRAHSREYYHANKEWILPKMNARAREIRQSNPERFHVIEERYRDTHKQQIQERLRQWYRDHPGAAAKQRHLRRARLRQCQGVFTADEWLALCEKYGYRCLACGEKKTLTVDHVIPISRGGRNDIHNIQPLCGRCNNKKHAKTIDYRPA